jgi:cytidylate kinase
VAGQPTGALEEVGDAWHPTGEGAGGVVTGSSPAANPPLVTMAGLYGTGISRIGPQVAERLGVPFLDRRVLTGVAERLRVPEASIETYDPDSEKAPRGRLRRFLDNLEQPATADTSPGSDQEVRRLRSATEHYLARATVRGGVVVGRGGMVVLRRVPGVLHVRLDGPRPARVEQAMRVFGLDRRTAEQRQRENDRARIMYVREEYGVDPDDPDLYHLRIDSTVLDWDTCVDLIVAAAGVRTRQPADGPHSGADLRGAP